MLHRLRNMYTLGASLRPRVYHARLVPPGIVSLSTSIPRRASTQPQQQSNVQVQVQPPQPIVEQKSFASLGSLVHPLTLQAITQTPYKHVYMSPVQEKVLGMMSELVETVEGKDLLVRAKTGTGKTLAFLVPGIERRMRVIERLADEELGKEEGAQSPILRGRLMNRFARETMGVLVISPTRELATQIAVSANNLSMHHADKGKGFGVQLFVGGENRGRQMRSWVEGRKDVVVGTPGRLMDLLENWESRGVGAQMGLKEVFGNSGDCVVVLDEADTLLDMGFRKDVESILGHLKRGSGSQGKQTWMFSATVGRGVESIVRESMRKDKWEYVDCVGRSEENDVHSHVKQVHTVIGDGGGMGSLVHFLRLIVHDQLSVMKRNREGEKGMRSKMLVFFSTTKMTRLFGKLLRELSDRGGLIFPFKKLRVYEMHARKEMNERVRISQDFRERPIGEDEGVVMVSSDVSARGVDYPGVGRVVQMGVPGSREGYVHRVGRTGRGDVKEGRGDLVLAPWEIGFMKVLGDVGMEPVTVEGLKSEIEALAVELGGGELSKKVERIEDIAKHVANAGVGENRRVAVCEDDYRDAWASMVGFYVGSWDGLGIGAMNDAIQGSGRWVEQLGGLETGSLAAGPGSGLPRSLLDRLQKELDRGGGARGGRGREKAWGNSRNQAGEWGWNANRSRPRSQDGDSRPPWKSRDGDSRPPWKSHDGDSRPPWKSHDGDSRPAWKSRDGDNRPPWKSHDGDSRPAWKSRDGDSRPAWKSRDGDSRPAWKSRDGESRPPWKSHDGDSRPSWKSQDGDSRPAWKSRDGDSRPSWRNREEGDRPGQDGDSRSEKFGGWLGKKREEGHFPRKIGRNMKVEPSWMGRGKVKKNRE